METVSILSLSLRLISGFSCEGWPCCHDEYGRTCSILHLKFIMFSKAATVINN